MCGVVGIKRTVPGQETFRGRRNSTSREIDASLVALKGLTSGTQTLALVTVWWRVETGNNSFGRLIQSFNHSINSFNSFVVVPTRGIKECSK